MPTKKKFCFSVGYMTFSLITLTTCVYDIKVETEGWCFVYKTGYMHKNMSRVNLTPILIKTFWNWVTIFDVTKLKKFALKCPIILLYKFYVVMIKLKLFQIFWYSIYQQTTFCTRLSTLN